MVYYDIPENLDLSAEASAIFLLSFASRRLRAIDYELSYRVNNPEFQLLQRISLTRRLYNLCARVLADNESFS